MKITSAAIVFMFLPSFTPAQVFMSYDGNCLLNSTQEPKTWLCAIDNKRVSEMLVATHDLNLPKKQMRCYPEAGVEYICKKLAGGSGCEIAKLWVFAPSIYTLIRKQKLSVSDHILKGEDLAPDYVVAPLVLVQNGNRVDSMVLDLSIAGEELIPLNLWLKKLNCKDAIYTVTGSTYYLFYSIEGFTRPMNKTPDTNKNTDHTKIITGHFWQLSKQDSSAVASGMAYNDLAIYLTEKYYHNQDYSAYAEQIKSLIQPKAMKKMISGKQTDLPGLLVEDCTNYFAGRLNYWTKQNI